jgi:hypothetical protein
MHAIAPLLIAASSAILLFLGAVHVVITCRGPSLTPRDRALGQLMQDVSPMISRETTMWNAWLGFNASHGLGVMLFGAPYLDLALRDGDVLRHERVLQGIGLAGTLTWGLLAFRHWLSVPQAGVSIAALLYVGGLAAMRA